MKKTYYLSFWAGAVPDKRWRAQCNDGKQFFASTPQQANLAALQAGYVPAVASSTTCRHCGNVDRTQCGCGIE